MCDQETHDFPIFRVVVGEVSQQNYIALFDATVLFSWKKQPLIHSFRLMEVDDMSFVFFGC